MVALNLLNVPNRTDLFLDSNIFIYAFLRQSQQCMGLLKRCAREEVLGITSLDVIQDVTHRLMLAEAVSKGIINRQNASALKGKHTAIRTLSEYWSYTARIFQLNILLIDVNESLVRSAQDIRTRFGLLTKDSLLIATMDEFAIGNIASRDADFVHITHLTVYQPTDVQGDS